MGKSNLNSGFLISYDWLPALESLSAEDYKTFLSALIRRQKEGVPLPHFENEIVNIFARMIEPTIKRRLDGQEGGNKAREGTTIGTTVGTTIGTTVSSKEKKSKENISKAKLSPLNPSKRGKETAQTNSFESFWKVYPKKQSKLTAQKAWEKLNPDTELTEAIINAVERAKMSRQWKEKDGQYIPLPASYLNQRRWEDDLSGEIAPWSQPCPDFLADL